MVKNVTVIGGGLAGSEAAWQLAKRGIEVDLYEMRPKKNTPAHETANFAELVCTNSMRSNQLSNAVGLLKEEMRQLDSLIMKAADETAVPAGGALAVDRDKFSAVVTKTLKDLPNVHVHEEEITEIPKDGITIIATGPLTSDTLAEQIKEFCGTDSLHFFDAAAPIVAASSINRDIVYKKSRYDKGEAAYLNCPMTKEEFYNFYKNLVAAETATLHGFEDKNVFEGCMPIEVMAKRGEKTILNVTIKHLMTMKTPLKCKYDPWVKVCSSDDWTIASLDFIGGRKGITNEFKYNTVCLHVLTGIILTGYPPILGMVYVNRSCYLQAIKIPPNFKKRSRRDFKAWQISPPKLRFFYSVGLFWYK